MVPENCLTILKEVKISTLHSDPINYVNVKEETIKKT